MNKQETYSPIVFYQSLDLFFVHEEKNKSRPSDKALSQAIPNIINLLSAHWKKINSELDLKAVQDASEDLSSKNDSKLYLIHHAAASLFNAEAYVGYHVGQVVFEVSYPESDHSHMYNNISSSTYTANLWRQKKN
jgi:hypothetical protein